ncbi:MAG: CapA family protein [Parcubacteria group bacterium]
MRVFGICVLIILAIIIVWFFVFNDSPDIIIENTDAIDVIIPDDTDKNAITVLAVGDMMLGRYVETLMNEHGMFYPFEDIGSVFLNFDIVFGNLEGPITFAHEQTPNNSTKFSFQPDIAPLLSNNHFNLVTLANNHTDDQGEEAYDNTVFLLEDNNIESFGHASDIGDISMTKKIIKGREITFIGFNATYPIFDEEEAIDVVETQASGSESFVAVNMHWGNEYTKFSSSKQRNLAHKLIDAGADVIIGHHPHVVQEIEIYEGKPIFYSLGNFIFDQYFSNDVQQGLMVAMSIDDIRVEYFLVPIKSIQSQPRLIDGDEREAFLRGLAVRSDNDLAESIKNGKIVIE